MNTNIDELKSEDHAVEAMALVGWTKDTSRGMITADQLDALAEIDDAEPTSRCMPAGEEDNVEWKSSVALPLADGTLVDLYIYWGFDSRVWGDTDPENYNWDINDVDHVDFW